MYSDAASSTCAFGSVASRTASALLGPADLGSCTETLRHSPGPSSGIWHTQHPGAAARLAATCCAALGARPGAKRNTRATGRDILQTKADWRACNQLLFGATHRFQRRKTARVIGDGKQWFDSTTGALSPSYPCLHIRKGPQAAPQVLHFCPTCRGEAGGSMHAW